MILKGNCLDTLKTLETASVDSIVTDPPYELGFMGKSWDNSGIAYNQDLWAECLRVLKPGGHLLAFSGSRTYHRMVVAIEDSGFEIRDQIMWLYGSGFPKSLDVSKAIDKSDRKSELNPDNYRFTEWMRSTDITGKQINELTKSNMGNHYLTDKQQPAVPTPEMFDRLRSVLPDVPGWVETLIRLRAPTVVTESQNFKNREVIGVQKNAMAGWSMDGTTQFADRDITTPATPEAQQWQGWGTALKPAHEPIVVARKPLIGTVANNVLTYGTGAINIDGSRVGSEIVTTTNGKGFNGSFEGGTNNNGGAQHEGRWPANVIHDGSDEVLAGFPEHKSSARKVGKITGTTFGSNTPMPDDLTGVLSYGDSGSAARFFYCAKASKSERNAGLEGLPERHAGVGDTRPSGDFSQRLNKTDKPTQPRANFHPTVKPLALMRYLIKLVTPPNGTVLDPFLGSGSTAVAAILEGFEWIGCEMTEDYFSIIEARVEWALNQPKPMV